MQIFKHVESHAVPWNKRQFMNKTPHFLKRRTGDICNAKQNKKFGEQRTRFLEGKNKTKIIDRRLFYFFC